MNPFNELPDNFFVPLSFRNREHYAALILVFYDLFIEYHSGVERMLVVSSFEQYFIGLGNAAPLIEAEDDGDAGLSIPGDRETNGSGDAAGREAEKDASSPRSLASVFVRKLIHYGWLLEEVLADFTQVVNMPVWAKPFYLALHEVTKGSQVEYESHIIGIYSSLCSDSASENGHHAVLNARSHMRLLIDSLKLLSQNIKTHVAKIFESKTEVKELLHIHYDIYMHEIVDKAYNRLKTSDNLSKYRPLIVQAINRYLSDDAWISTAASKLGVIRNRSLSESRKDLIEILNEIRDDLRSIDPILEEIDDKNRQYSRISTEKIKARLYADSSLEGKIQEIIRVIVRDETGGSYRELGHKIPGIGYLVRESLYTRKRAKDEDISFARPVDEDFEIELLEAELLRRIRNQLNPAKVAEYLNDVCHKDGTPTQAEEILTDIPSFVRLLYACAYAEGRQSGFPFRVEWGDRQVQKGRFVFREHFFLGKREGE